MLIAVGVENFSGTIRVAAGPVLLYEKYSTICSKSRLIIASFRREDTTHTRHKEPRMASRTSPTMRVIFYTNIYSIRQ